MHDSERFERLLALGATRSALEAALDLFERDGGRDSGGCVSRLDRATRLLDVRGAGFGIPELRERIEVAFRKARLPVTSAAEAVWQPRSAEIGLAAFPVVQVGGQPEVGALRWLRVEKPEPAGRTASLGHSSRTAITIAYEVISRLLPDGIQELDGRVRLEVVPNLPSNENLDGDSLGAAAAVALASYLLRLPVAPTYVFSGALDRHGRLNPVDPFTLGPKRAALRELPQALFLVAPGHPEVQIDAGRQIGGPDRLAELLTLALGPWWGRVDSDRSVWVDRSWREALRLEAWFLSLVERHGRLVETTDGTQLEESSWRALVAQLATALDAWRDHFVEGVRMASSRAPTDQPESDGAVEGLEDPPTIGEISSGALPPLSAVRDGVRRAVTTRRSSLEAWLLR